MQEYNKLVELFEDIKREGFYGTLSFQFRSGNVQIIRKEQTINASEFFTSNNERIDKGDQ